MSTLGLAVRAVWIGCALLAPVRALADTLANPPLVVSIRGAGAVRDPGSDVGGLISAALGGRLVTMVEPTVEEARAALYVADVVYLNLRQRSSSEAGAAGLVFGRGDEALTTRSLADTLAHGRPPPRLILMNGSGAGADLGDFLDPEKTAVVGFSGPVHGLAEEAIFARLCERLATCEGTTCPTLREAFDGLPATDRPPLLVLRGRANLRFPSLGGHAANAASHVQIRGTVTDKKGKPAPNAQVTTPSFPGGSAVTDDKGGFVMTLVAPAATAIRVRATIPHQIGVVTTDGGLADRKVEIRLQEAPDEIAALAARLGVPVTAQPPYLVNDKKAEDHLRSLVVAYLHDSRMLRFSLDEIAPLLARFDQAFARGTRRPMIAIGPPPNFSRPLTLCDDPELRYVTGRLRDLRGVYQQRFIRVDDGAKELTRVAGLAPHLAERTDAAAILAAARLLRRDYVDGVRRLDHVGYALRSVGCRDELIDVARPLYDPDIPFDFADRLPGGTRPTILPPRL